MKLRNKKTGVVIEPDRIAIIRNIKETSEASFDKITGNYYSLAGLNKEWEDYKPAEPLIKDEKIRKAVRAWAEVNEISKCVCKEEMHCITFETERGMFISFENADPIPPEGNYTIAELCGEE